MSGKKAAVCKQANLTNVPNWLSPEIQHIDLSNNPLHSLPKGVFMDANLINLHKIYLKDCGIQEVDKDAFKRLEILIELNLSNNRIHTLHPGTFSDTVRLRVLVINHNPIQKLEDGLFNNLMFLHWVEISDSQLSHISYMTFNNVPNISTLNLAGNNLTHMKLATVEKLVKLRSLVLHNNPWRCDCHLKAFRDWTIDRNLYAQPTACDEPPRLHNKQWNEIDSEEFACKPQITWPPPGSVLTAETEVTLSCHVNGNPPPEVYWVFNNRIITNNTRTTYGDQRYTIKASGESVRWVNLTVNRVRPQDRGEFTCVAKSVGGTDQRNVTLSVPAGSGGSPATSLVGASWPWIIGSVTGIVALVIVVVVLCCCFCRKKERPAGKKGSGNGLSPNGDIGHHRIVVSPEQEKCLLPGVNPIKKPPRVTNGDKKQPSVTGSELSEQNRNLLDEGSFAAPIEGAEEDQSLESKDTTPHRSRDKLDADALPPDLIPPGRGPNVSPAGSSASTAVDTSRFPPHLGPQSPIHNYHGFGTLPYASSHSPFSPPPGPVVLPRQGYVTIPRRPRVPSWSSAPTPTLLDDPLSPIRAEPVYDNLGPRTTADGSSVLSLNKSIGPETPRSRSNNTLPPGAYIPFDERMSPPGRGWPMRTLDGAGMKRAGSAEGPIGLTTSTPRSKVAPKPPPKPKKNGPLYEDEGEDGTEV
ncbi:hypothetical protein AAG570_012863 [Ranatra chinensis]|uniref:Ig-like domain-containing protein n=1 Tax=Ranatra chinensis TaxID=642074 RepID=A0ABD0YH05_9HEMI